METEKLQNEEALVSDTTNNLIPAKEKELIQSSEAQSNTKSILEGICSDFQNIDVFSTKDKSSKEPGPSKNSSEIKKSSNPNLNKSAGHSTNNENPISNHITNTVKNVDSKTASALPVKDSSSKTCTVTAATDIKAALQQCGLQKPVSTETIIANNKIISSSLAEVADAEIVQTDDNLVSIIITNPRLIQVLNSEDGKQQYSSLPQTVGAVPKVESVVESVIVEPSPVAQQDLAFQSEINAVADEIVYDGHLEEKGVKRKKKYKLSSTSKGKTKASVFKQKTDSGKMTRARRISAKMKTEWAKTLAKKRVLVCPMQGCCQKYVTIANFVTHYKFCPGQTELKHCPHCSSLIYSDNKAMLHHMEVEHPDKVEEFKATVSDDESSSVYDEEEIPETAIQIEKRKISSLSKENQSPKGKKHKIFKSIAHETEIENIKEFRKCVRFDNIVSKINSCDQVDTPDDDLQMSDEPTFSKSPKERKRRLVLTGKIVEEEKYFEDADEFLSREPKPENDNFKLNTKSRLVLNLERYKQFNQHLKLTRDWSSARKTYSRSRISDSSLDGSFTSVQTIADCPKDDHQLDDLCLKSSNGENDSEVLYYAEIPKELSEYDLQDPKAIQRTRPSLISQNNSERKRVGILKEKIENTKEIESQIVTKPSVFTSPTPERPQNGFVLKEKKVPCYLRDTISNSTPKSTPDVRKPVTKVGPIITYGKNIPTPEEKKIKTEKCPVIDFDTLFKNSMKEMKLLREKTVPAAENVSGIIHSKQNGVKEPVVEKRKRGRPRKNKVLPEEEQTNESTNTREAGIKMVNGEQNIDIGPNAAKAKNLKNSQNRAYIKSKRQRSIKNLNSKRINQSHMVGKQDPPSMMIDGTKTNEVTTNNILIKTNENVVTSLPDKMPDLKEQNASTSIAENCESKLQTNESQQNLDSIPEKSTLPSPLNVAEPNNEQILSNKDSNIVKSVDCAPSDILNISNAVDPIAKQTEIITPVTIGTDNITAKPSSVDPVAKEQVLVEAILAPTAPTEEAVAKANVPTNNDSVILNNVTEPVKRRRGRPKKIIPNINANLHTVAVSMVGRDSETVQSKTVPSEFVPPDAGQSQAVQINAGQSEAAQTDAGQTQSAQTDVGKSEAAQTNAMQSQASQTDAGKSQEAQTDAGRTDATQVDAGQSPASQTDATKAQAGQTDAGQSEATQMDVGQSQAAQRDVVQSQAAQTDVVQPKVVESNAGQLGAEQLDSVESNIGQSISGDQQSVTIQSHEEQSSTVQSDAKQSTTAAMESDNGQSKAVQPNPMPDPVPSHSDVVQSESVMLDSKQSDVPVRKSLRTRNRNSSRSNDAFVFPTIKKEHSLLTSSEERTPPVQTGRRRGRPRKYPLKNDLNSSANDTLLKDDLNSSTGTPKPDMNSSVDEYPQKNNLNASASEPVHEQMNSVKEPTELLPNTEPQALRGKKKCGRPRKYPLKRDLNSSVSESDNCSELKGQPVAPARKRGRPRKYPLQSDVEASNQLNNSVNSGSKPVKEIETSKTALRKCPRKGRPVKCVHYEALNSHSSPPATKEIIQEKKVEANSDSSRVETPSTVKNKDSIDSTACPKPEKFILPPKKRKMSGEDESFVLSKEKCKDPDYLESEEVSSDESDVEQNKKLKKRDEDLPYIPEKRLKKHLKKSHSPSHKKAAVTPIKPSLEFLANFTGSVPEEIELFCNLKPVRSMFKTLSEEEWQEALPPVESICIRQETSECEQNWVKLKCFESLSNGALKYVTFFTGGPVSTSAFCPTPHNKIYDQYIAVATNYDFINVHYSSTKAYKGLIQIYNLGNLQDLTSPVLELALCHKNATITDMQWCPKGCYQEPPMLSSNTPILPRLGLLAVACADSFVRIYSVPHPKFLTATKVSKSNSLPFFKCSPSVILEPMCGTTRSAIATSLTWANTAACDQIAVGYGNGMVGVWLVNTTNSILLTSETAMVKTIIPYLVFQAHGTPVTSLQFAPLQNCRYLVSSGFDKTLKFFDLMDTSIPFCSAKRGCAISCQWSSSLCGAFVSLHDGITFKGSNYFKDAGTEEFPIQTISGSISSLTQSCVSDAINVLATADMKGSVSVKYIAKSTLCGSDPGKLPPLQTYKLFKAEVTSLENTIKLDMKIVKDSLSHLQDVIDITTELTTQVESDIISEDNKAIENSVSKVMDDILVTTEKQLADSHIREMDVSNLVTSLCETTVHSMNSLVEESSQEDLQSECRDTNSKSVVYDNMDSEMADIVDTLLSAASKASDNLGATSKQVTEISDTSLKDSDSPLLHNDPYHKSEVIPPNHLKSEVNSSAVNSFISKIDNEVTRASIDLCKNDPQNKQDAETTDLPTPSEGELEYGSKELPQTIESSDEDSFSSEDMDSDKESDIADDEEFNFSDDSMMSECSLSSKSSESSYSSDNAMDESISIDYIQDIESRCSPIPLATSLTESSVEISETKCNPTSNDLSLTEDCTQNIEAKSSPISNHSSSNEVCSQDSESNASMDATEDCSEASASKGKPPQTDSALVEDCSQSVDSKCYTSPNVSTSTETLNSTSTKISSDSEVVMSDSQDVVVPSSPPANLTDSSEISNNDQSDSTPETLDSEMCVPAECDSAEESVSTKDLAPKNLEPSIQQFYKQQTRTSKPYMQAFKSANEASVNNIEYENSGETVANTEREACINHSSSYKDIVSNHGIVFKDMHLGNTAECTSTNEEEMDKLPALEHNNFSSVNTIAWNPNHGCEYWLFSAGNSGVARLCCVSEINVPERMLRRKNT